MNQEKENANMQGTKAKKLKKGILIMSLVMFTTLTLGTGKVNAALQANGNSGTTKTLGDWLLAVRQMEAVGGTLGLSDTLNTSTLLSTATTSNNIDIHMEKNTEYGAMAILSASSYGNQSVIAYRGTTTGNKTGVYIYLNNEMVSAGCSELSSNVSIWGTANTKYKNIYTTTYSAKRGDAILNWHGVVAGTGSSYSGVWLNNKTNSILLRGHSMNVFSYYGFGTSDKYDAYYTKAWYTRAVVVVGNGF
jgi:hypothetical protein